MNSRTLLERFANLANPYKSKGKKQKIAIESVKKVIIQFLRTNKGSVATRSEYGMEDMANISVKLFSQDKISFLNYIEKNLLKVDPRISEVKVIDRTHTHQKDNTKVPYLAIEITLKSEFSESQYDESPKITLAYDLIGEVYQLKEQVVY